MIPPLPGLNCRALDIPCKYPKTAVCIVLDFSRRTYYYQPQRVVMEMLNARTQEVARQFSTYD